jgi:DNA polymerase III subunit gamma/tau
MKYQVIARKFRPQVFADVVGQAPIVRTLQNAIEMGRAGHAYLFSGPRGVGKTTMARLLAKALNCAQGPTPTPCNECPSCQEITNGNAIDVLEIDAASNTGVDSIRELRESARYAPSRDRFKIFIIDEVHMLSTSAFNALLKTLEEPPAHIVFIMATTERHKLPATILSRCQQFIFRMIPPAEIHSHLKAITEKEGLKIGEGALAYIVRAAGGSMRDAQSLLDQVVAFGAEGVSDDEVRDVLGFMPAELLSGSIDALAARDPKALLDIIEIVVDQGLHLQQFLRELLAQIRELLLVRLGLEDKLSGSPEDRARVASQASHFTEQELIRIFDLLLDLENDLKWASEPRFYLEVACVKLTEMGRLRNLEDVIKELKDSGVTASEPELAPGSPPGPAPRSQSGPEPTSKRDQDRKPNPAPAPDPPQARAAAATSPGREPSPAPAPRPSPPPSSPTPPAPEPEPAPTPKAPEPPPTQTTGEDADSMREAASAEPVVQSFLDVFRGEIAHVRSKETPNKPETDR